MRPSSIYALEDHDRVVATAAGTQAPFIYPVGTKGHVNIEPGESPWVMTDAGVNLGHVLLKNWERLMIPECGHEVIESEVRECGNEDMCMVCYDTLDHEACTCD